MREKEHELATALGGDPSPQEKILIADAIKTQLYVGTLDEYLMTLSGGIIRGGKVIPVIESRTQLAAHLRRDLEALGLGRKVNTRTLQDILNDDDPVNGSNGAEGNEPG